MLSVCSKDESDALDTLSAPINKKRFQSSLCRLNTLFSIYASTCPAPLIAPGLIVSPEIRIQSECYLPIADITSVFNRLYSAALTYLPILTSTPFHNALSWADTFAALPPQFQFSANPARFVELLLDDRRLLIRFLFASFLPDRFYGVIGRYPEQRQFIREWLNAEGKRVIHCLDAACGTGEDTYGLALLLSEEGFSPDEVRIDGWTLEPLEIWAATHRRFPHDRQREAQFREETSNLFEQGFQTRIRFRCVDLTKIPPHPPLTEGEVSCVGKFDLILCNGLLGGPIIHEKEQLNLAVANLAPLLAPGGVLLTADHFHGGWKQKCPQAMLRASFEANRLKYVEYGEGIGGLKPDQ